MQAQPKNNLLCISLAICAAATSLSACTSFVSSDTNQFYLALNYTPRDYLLEGGGKAPEKQEPNSDKGSVCSSGSSVEKRIPPTEVSSSGFALFPGMTLQVSETTFGRDRHWEDGKKRERRQNIPVLSEWSWTIPTNNATCASSVRYVWDRRDMMIVMHLLSGSRPDSLPAEGSSSDGTINRIPPHLPVAAEVAISKMGSAVTGVQTFEDAPGLTDRLQDEQKLINNFFDVLVSRSAVTLRTVDFPGGNFGESSLADSKLPEPFGRKWAHGPKFDAETGLARRGRDQCRARLGELSQTLRQLKGSSARFPYRTALEHSRRCVEGPIGTDQDKRARTFECAYASKALRYLGMNGSDPAVSTMLGSNITLLTEGDRYFLTQPRVHSHMTAAPFTASRNSDAEQLTNQGFVSFSLRIPISVRGGAESLTADVCETVGDWEQRNHVRVKAVKRLRQWLPTELSVFAETQDDAAQSSVAMPLEKVIGDRDNLVISFAAAKDKSGGDGLTLIPSVSPAGSARTGADPEDSVKRDFLLAPNDELILAK
jgi:hypothetical protein